MRKAALVAAGLATLGLASAHASAEEPAVVTHERVVSVEIARGHARLSMRRTIQTPTATRLPAALSIDLRDEEVVTGLRVQGANGWLDGALREGSEALDRYRAWSSGPTVGPTVLLSWSRYRDLALDVAAVAPGGAVEVEYTVTTSTFYAGGRDHVGLPSGGVDVAVRAASPGDVVYADDRAIGAAGVVQSGEYGIELSLGRPGARPLGGALGAVPLGDGRMLVRARVEAGASLAAAPRGARVAVLIDTSRSLSDDEVRAEAAAASAYLGHMPGAQVETILFDRRARAIHGGFVPAQAAIAALDQLTFTRRNGSALDEALARAATLFAGLGPEMPRRVLILTDGLTRRALDRDALRGLAQRTGALVHVGVLDATGTPRLERDDQHPLAALARPTGGLAWHVVAAPTGSYVPEMREACEAWAHPLRIDHVRVTAPHDEVAFRAPDRIDRGEGWSDLRIVDHPLGWLKIDGELWSQPISTTLVPDPDEARVAAALAFGSPLHRGLDATVTERLATLGHVVSPATSFVVAGRGVRGAPERPEVGYLDGGCLCGNHRTPLALEGDHRAPAPEVDLDAALRVALTPRWEACGGRGRLGMVTIEVTHSEVVDVTSARVNGPDGAKLARCLSDAAWEVELPDAFLGVQRAFDVAL
ncbi:MAG: VWA domain-containing protein [Minicystis sp.]